MYFIKFLNTRQKKKNYRWNRDKEILPCCIQTHTSSLSLSISLSAVAVSVFTCSPFNKDYLSWEALQSLIWIQRNAILAFNTEINFSSVVCCMKWWARQPHSPERVYTFSFVSMLVAKSCNCHCGSTHFDFNHSQCCCWEILKEKSLSRKLQIGW